MTEPVEPISDGALAYWRDHADTPSSFAVAMSRPALRRLLARLDAAEAAAVPNGWEVVRVDGIPYLTPDRIRPLTEGEASDA